MDDLDSVEDADGSFGEEDQSLDNFGVPDSVPVED